MGSERPDLLKPAKRVLCGDDARKSDRVSTNCQCAKGPKWVLFATVAPRPSNGPIHGVLSERKWLLPWRWACAPLRISRARRARLGRRQRVSSFCASDERAVQAVFSSAPQGELLKCHASSDSLRPGRAQEGPRKQPSCQWQHFAPQRVPRSSRRSAGWAERRRNAGH